MRITYNCTRLRQKNINTANQKHHIRDSNANICSFPFKGKLLEIFLQVGGGQQYF